MSERLHLALHGADQLRARLREEIVYIIRTEFGPIVTEAGRTLRLTTASSDGDLNLDFDSESPGGRACRNTVLGEDGTGSVWVRAHEGLRVCGPRDSRSGLRDVRRFLTTDWLLGRALANTGLHELGHFIANLDHSADINNYMWTGGLSQSQRTIQSQREAWAGRKTFTSGQRANIVSQLKVGVWLGDMIVQ